MNELKEILKEIDERIDRLDENDVQGHIWWNRFKNLIKDILEPEASATIKQPLRRTRQGSEQY